MIRLVGEGAHIAGADVQQMIGTAGEVGDSAPDLRAFLDQGDAQLAGRIAQQMTREQRAAGAAADDNDIRPRFREQSFRSSHTCHTHI